MRVLGQNSWQRGGPVSLRAIVLNHQTGKAVPAQVRLTLTRPKKAAYALRAGQTNEMPLTSLGVPPGFVVPPEAFEAAVATGTISKYTGAAPQIIVYPQALAPGRSVRLMFGTGLSRPVPKALANKDALVPLSRSREPFRRAPAYSPHGHPQTSHS